ncbi:uncharacterized, partial [Tachysurus ichikawai]
MASMCRSEQLVLHLLESPPPSRCLGWGGFG